MSKFNFNIDNIDIENNLDNTTLQKSMNNVKSQKRAYVESLYVVDLELPSGNKWCEYNLGVNINSLNKSTNPEDWYGNYYAWGEIKSKSNFTIKNYKWHTKNTYYDGMIKYTVNNYNSFYSDDRFTLENEDDAAYQYKKIKSVFCIPSKYDFDELIEHTKEKWVKDYNDIVGLNGRSFTGKNGNELFFPAAGCYNDRNGFNGEHNRGYYWTRNLNWGGWNEDAYNLYFDGYSLRMSNERRYQGFTIRPILNDKEKREE